MSELEQKHQEYIELLERMANTACVLMGNIEDLKTYRSERWKLQDEIKELKSTVVLSDEFLEMCEKELARHDCPTCVEIYNDNVNAMYPRHYASDYCKSGKRPHCSCDTCF